MVHYSQGVVIYASTYALIAKYYSKSNEEETVVSKASR